MCEFICDKDCKAYCCRQIDRSEEMKDFISDDGHTCMFLTPDNKCEIYDTRPECCNIELFWENNLKDKVSKEEFYKVNREYCKILREQYNKLKQEEGIK